MSNNIEPIKSVDEARQLTAQLTADPCIPQSIHEGFSRLTVADVVHAAMGDPATPVKNAADFQLTAEENTLEERVAKADVAANLPEADRQAIEEIRKEGLQKVFHEAHIFNDAAMPPKPTSCRGR